MASTGPSSNQDKAPIGSESSPRSSSPPRMSSFQDELSTKLLSEGRTVRLVIYGALIEYTRQIWLDSQASFRDVANELVTMNLSGEFVILQPHWGPKPHWTVADANSGIESSCQVLYAVFMRTPVRYIVGLVRTQELDYPIVIFEGTERHSMTISQAVITSKPTLAKLAKSISRYPDGQDVSHHLIDYDELETSNSLTFPTVLIITVDKPLGDLLSDLPSNPVPMFLQIPLAYCEHLSKRAYNLNHFSFQMIHVSRAIRHLLICLVQRIGDAYGKQNHCLGDALNTGGDLADLLRLALLYSRALQALLERANGIADRLESPTFIRSEIQNAIGGVFNDICGDYPGSIVIRYSHTRLEELAKMDREEELQARGTQVPSASNLDHRIARLDEGAARMITFHSGTRPDAPISLLEALEDYYRLFPNTPVINIHRRSSGNRRKGAIEKVTCGFCSKSGKFQKIADHIVCEHFKLTLWYCGWNSCPASMSRKSDRDRHLLFVHNIARPSISPSHLREVEAERRSQVSSPVGSPPTSTLPPGPGLMRNSTNLSISMEPSYFLGEIINWPNDIAPRLDIKHNPTPSHQEARGRLNTGRPRIFDGGVYPPLVHTGTALLTDRVPSLPDESPRLFYPDHSRNNYYGLGMGTSSDAIRLSEQKAARTLLPSTPTLQVERYPAFDGYSPLDFLSPSPRPSSSRIGLLPLPKPVHRVTTPIQSKPIQFGIDHPPNLSEGIPLPLPPSSTHYSSIQEFSEGPMVSYPMTLSPEYYPPRAQINMPNAAHAGSLSAGHWGPALNMPPSRSYTPYPIDEEFAFNFGASDALFSRRAPDALLPSVHLEPASSAPDIGNRSLPEEVNDVDSEQPDVTVSSDQPEK